MKRPPKAQANLLAGQETKSRSKLGVDEVLLDAFEEFKLNTDREPLSKELPRMLGTRGGVITFPVTIYSVITSLLNLESVVYI